MKKQTFFAVAVMAISMTLISCANPSSCARQGGVWDDMTQTCRFPNGPNGGNTNGNVGLPISSFVFITNVKAVPAVTNGGRNHYQNDCYLPAGYVGQPGTVSTQNVQNSFQMLNANGTLGIGGRAIVDQNLLQQARIQKATADLASSVGATIISLFNQGQTAQIRNRMNQMVLIGILESGNAPDGIYGASSVSQDGCLVAPYIYHQIIGYQLVRVGDIWGW